MSLERFRERLAVASVRKNDRMWLPRWIARYLATVRDSRSVSSPDHASNDNG